MKLLLTFITLFLVGCATADITLDREKSASVKRMIIAPFTSKHNLKPEILLEAEEKFRITLVNLGYNVVDRDELNILQKQKGNSTVELTADELTTAAQKLGADAVLWGEIITHSEYIEVKRPFMMILGNFPPGSKGSGYDREHTTAHFKVNIAVRLTSTYDGKEIFSVKNRYGDYRIEDPDRLMPILTLDICRRDVLDKMTKELAGKIREGE